jgi:hypothetical protein
MMNLTIVLERVRGDLQGVGDPQPDGRESEPVLAEDASAEGGPAGAEELARITLRVPVWLERAVERAADPEGVSIDAWLRAIARATEIRPGQTIGRRLSGYAKS